MLFSELFITILISLALLFVGISSILLIVMLIKDYKEGKVW